MKDNSLQVSIRVALVDDGAAIDRLIVYLDQFHAEARPDLFRASVGSPRGDDFVQAVLDDPKQQILVAVLGGQIVGYAHVRIKNTADSNHQLQRRYSEIETISVDPAARRLGVGRKLMHAATNWAELKQVHDHQIAVHEFNQTARALYEELGFAPSVTVLRRTSDE